MNRGSANLLDGSQAVARSQSPRRTVVFLFIHYLINASIIFLIASCHPYSVPELKPDAGLSEQLLQLHLVLIESLILTLPGLVLGSLFSGWCPRLALRAGTFLISLTPLIYFADLMSHLILGTPLFSPTTYGLIVTILPWFSDYTAQTDFMPLVITFGVYLVFEGLSLWLSRRATISQIPDRHQRVLLVTSAVLLLAPLAIWLPNPVELVLRLQRLPSRHPICASGLIGHAVSATHESQDERELLVATHLVSLQPALEKFENEYEALEITSPPIRRPDIVIIMAESFRYDAMTPQSAPNLTAFSQRALLSQLHFSGGNSSQYGLYATMFGLDSLLYPRAVREMSPALTRLLQQVGYHCSFLGNVGIDTLEEHHFIDRYINPETFDDYEIGKSKPYYKKDQYFRDKALRILNREGEFKYLTGKPVCLFMFMYTTHSEYHYESQDEVFTPVERDKATPPPYSVSKRELAKNRYLNSVHCLDRIIAPLWASPERVVVFCGDHGESFGEDGRYFHGTTLSFIQNRTPFIIYLPDVPARSLSGPTSHTDVLPTLVSYLGVTLNNPHVLSGRSVMGTDTAGHPAERMLSLRANVSHHHVLYDFGRPSLSPIVHFDIDLWKPSFSVVDVTDEMAIPLAWNDEDIEGTVRSLTRLLDQLLGVRSHLEDVDPVVSLIEALEHPHPKVNLAAIEVLGHMGLDAKPAIPALKRCLDSNNRQIHSKAKETLWDLLLIEE